MFNASVTASFFSISFLRKDDQMLTFVKYLPNLGGVSGRSRNAILCIFVCLKWFIIFKEMNHEEPCITC